VKHFGQHRRSPMRKFVSAWDRPASSIRKGSGCVLDRNDGIGAMAPGHYGTDGTGVTLSEATIAAAWNVQGDPTRSSFVTGVQQLFDVPLPLIPNTTKRSTALLALWLGPRSWLLVERSPSNVPSALIHFGSRRDAVNLVGGALFDVSASRVAYRIRGTDAASVLAKSCPLDFDPGVFAAGACAQSIFGHMNGLFYRQNTAPNFLMFVARSLAHDAWQTLCRSAAQVGYDVEQSLS
jgi:heterotetrameric sarcosine oxidase gamma subunit